MLPEGRLECLLEQALTHQLAKMDVRVPLQMPVSLLTDYSFSRGHIPTHTTQAWLCSTELNEKGCMRHAMTLQDEPHKQVKENRFCYGGLHIVHRAASGLCLADADFGTYCCRS